VRNQSPAIAGSGLQPLYALQGGPPSYGETRRGAQTGLARQAVVANIRTRKAAVPLVGLVSHLELLPFRDSTFDVCFAGWALHHFSNVAPVVRELRRVLKDIRRILRPGGFFFLTAPYGPGGRVIRPTDRVLDKARWQRLLVDWTVRDKLYCHQDEGGTWHQVSEGAAGRTSVALALVEAMRLEPIA